jgi:hypothetical protein
MMALWEVDELVGEARATWFYVAGKVPQEEKNDNKDLKRLSCIEKEVLNTNSFDYAELMNEIMEIEQKYRNMPDLCFEKIKAEAKILREQMHDKALVA